MKYLHLADIPINAIAWVKTLHAEGGLRRRLLDMGLTPGAKVFCLLSGPAGDPRAYRIRGTTIALRSEDAKAVEITLIKEGRQADVSKTPPDSKELS